MGKYRRIGTDSHGFITRTDVKRLTDPSPLAEWEYDFGGFFPNSNNPLRLGEYAQAPAAWTDCKIVDGEIVPMTEEDKALRDAEAQAQADAEEQAMQAAKSDDLKGADNDYITLCDLIRTTAGQQATQTKLSTVELSELLELIEQVNTPLASKFGLKIIGALEEVKYHGGCWDTIVWHSEIVG